MEYFTITTNREVADQIKRQCIFDEKMGFTSYELGKISHEENYSVVQIKAKDGKQIKPEDLFWLGHLSAELKTKCDRCNGGNIHINNVCDNCIQELVNNQKTTP